MRRALAALAVLVATLALIELTVWATVEIGWLETPRPRYFKPQFWRGHHPQFGVWHEPDASTIHTSACFAATYHTNSVGARDRERTRSSDAHRVVVLGDSFLEGWGVADEKRMSNLLERATRVEHLNFAMSHFGPYQQVIVYEKLAAQFDHDAVIASLAPINDFLDLDLERAQAMANYDYRYRPYLVGEPPDFRHVDHREPGLRLLLRRVSYAFNAALAAARAWSRSDEAEPTGGSDTHRPSSFYDFDEADLARLTAVLERLTAATAGKPTVLVVIPTLRDLERRAVSGPDPLSPRLAEIAARLDIRLVDLMAPMASESLHWRDWFFPCDYHWSELGNRFAAEAVLEQAGAVLYPDQTVRSSKASAIR